MPTGSRWEPSADERRMLAVLRALMGEERGALTRLAEDTGISVPQLSKYLAGQKSMTMAEFDAVCRSLRREPWEVMKMAQGR